MKACHTSKEKRETETSQPGDPRRASTASLQPLETSRSDQPDAVASIASSWTRKSGKTSVRTRSREPATTRATRSMSRESKRDGFRPLSIDGAGDEDNNSERAGSLLNPSARGSEPLPVRFKV